MKLGAFLPALTVVLSAVTVMCVSGCGNRAGGQSANRGTEQIRDVVGLAFSPDGKTLATSSASRSPISFTLSFWDIGSGRLIRAIRSNTGFFVALAFSPDGRLLVSGSDHGVELWDVRSGHRLGAFSNLPAYDFSFFRDGKRLLALAEEFDRWHSAKYVGVVYEVG